MIPLAAMSKGMFKLRIVKCNTADTILVSTGINITHFRLYISFYRVFLRIVLLIQHYFTSSRRPADLEWLSRSSLTM